MVTIGGIQGDPLPQNPWIGRGAATSKSKHLPVTYLPVKNQATGLDRKMGDRKIAGWDSFCVFRGQNTVCYSNRVYGCPRASKSGNRSLFRFWRKSDTTDTQIAALKHAASITTFHNDDRFLEVVVFPSTLSRVTHGVWFHFETVYFGPSGPNRKLPQV